MAIYVMVSWHLENIDPRAGWRLNQSCGNLEKFARFFFQAVLFFLTSRWTCGMGATKHTFFNFFNPLDFLLDVFGQLLKQIVEKCPLLHTWCLEIVVDKVGHTPRRKEDDDVIIIVVGVQSRRYGISLERCSTALEKMQKVTVGKLILLHH
jgi:hypothetical protein